LIDLGLKRVALRILVMATAVGTSIAACWAGDWPYWRGPNRNDVVAEDSGFERGAWPPKKVLWEKNVGEGGTSPIVVGRRLMVMGFRDGRDTLYCFDVATGREMWKVAYPAPRFGRNAMGDQGLYSGVTSTPEFDPATGLVYTLSIDGDLNCFDTNRAGRRVWGINLYDRYHMQQRERIGRSGRRDYGYTTSPLVQGERLIVEVGGNRGTLMAFDKRTGRELWGSQFDDKAGHTGGPVPIAVAGVPCVAVLTLHHLLVVRIDAGHEGKTVAAHPWTTEFANNIATPTVHENQVLITSGYNQASACLLDVTLRGARVVWRRPVHSNVCSPVIHDGHVYWLSKHPVCLELATGRSLWPRGPFFGDAGSCIVTSDERLIIWGHRGELVLAETARRSPDRYTELARVGKMFRTDVWPHVVLSDGRLICKDRDGNMKCFSLRD